MFLKILSGTASYFTTRSLEVKDRFLYFEVNNNKSSNDNYSINENNEY